jgi:hypothetical protein
MVTRPEALFITESAAAAAGDDRVTSGSSTGSCKHAAKRSQHRCHLPPRPDACHRQRPLFLATCLELCAVTEVRANHRPPSRLVPSSLHSPQRMGRVDAAARGRRVCEHWSPVAHWLHLKCPACSGEKATEKNGREIIRLAQVPHSPLRSLPAISVHPSRACACCCTAPVSLHRHLDWTAPRTTDAFFCSAVSLMAASVPSFLLRFFVFLFSFIFSLPPVIITSLWLFLFTPCSISTSAPTR